MSQSFEDRIADAKRPLLIAHRGFQTDDGIVENTIPAFEAALKNGADGIELDIRMSADGELMVFHDYTLWRMISKPWPVNWLNRNVLQTYVLMGASGGRIPTLNEVFRALEDKLYYNIEIKPRAGGSERLIVKLLETINRLHLEQNVWISSSDWHLLRRLKKKAPKMPTALLVENWNHRVRKKVQLSGVEWIHPSVELLGQLPTIRKTGKLLGFWTVNQDEDLVTCTKDRVEVIITDQINKAKNVVY